MSDGLAVSLLSRAFRCEVHEPTGAGHVNDDMFPTLTWRIRE